MRSWELKVKIFLQNALGMDRAQDKVTLVKKVLAFCFST